MGGNVARRLAVWSVSLLADHVHRTCADTNMGQCPIRLPAAAIRHLELLQDLNLFDNSTSDFIIFEEPSAAQFGERLPSQSHAMHFIAADIDSWGSKEMKTASSSVVHHMASSWRLGAKEHYDNKFLPSQVILPPAHAMLLVGLEGAGKLYIAEKLASVLFDHCGQSLWIGNSTESIRQPILEIFAQDYFGFLGVDENMDPFKGQVSLHPLHQMIIDHIKSREGFGSAVILHHVEHIPISFLTHISQVLSGKTSILSYKTHDGEVFKALCDGTLFLFTSKDWGTKSILRAIQKDSGISRPSRGTLISSIRHEVGKITGIKFARSISTVAPFLLPEANDLAILVRRDFDETDRLHRGTHWKSLQISNDALNHLVSNEHVKYFDMVNGRNSSEVMLTHAVEGFHALKTHELLGKISNSLHEGFQPKPDKFARLFYDVKTNRVVFYWCNNSIDENCAVVWRVSGTKQSPITVFFSFLAKLARRMIQFFKSVFDSIMSGLSHSLSNEENKKFYCHFAPKLKICYVSCDLKRKMKTKRIKRVYKIN